MKTKLVMIAAALTGAACNSTLDDFPPLSTADAGGTGGADSGLLYPQGCGFEMERELHFGILRQGQHRTRVLTIGNPFDYELPYVLPNAVYVTFHIQNYVLGEEHVLPVGGSADIEIQFSPTQVGHHEEEFRMYGCGTSPFPVPLAGDAIAIDETSFVCQSKARITIYPGECATRTLSCLNAASTPATVLSIAPPVVTNVNPMLEALSLPLTVPADTAFEFDLEVCSGSVIEPIESRFVAIEVDDGAGPRTLQIALEMR